MHAPDPTPPIRALIVDDELHGRINLRYALARHPHWVITGECDCAADARAQLASQQVDVLFLDIQMPGESGTALARALSVQPEPPLVIFVTAYSDHAVDAFELHAIDYLLKPFSDKRLAQTLERAAALLVLRQQGAYGQALRAYLDGEQARHSGQASPYWRQVTVRAVGQMELVQLDDVLAMVAAGNYVELRTAARTILHRIPLGTLEAHLDPQQFLRIHRTAIVRRDQCVSLQSLGEGSYQLGVRSGDSLPVSERYVQALRACLAGPADSR